MPGALAAFGAPHLVARSAGRFPANAAGLPDRGFGAARAMQFPGPRLGFHGRRPTFGKDAREDALNERHDWRTPRSLVFERCNSHNMSRKSGFNGFSLHLPSVNRELPHHRQSLLGRRANQVGFSTLIAQCGHANCNFSLWHGSIMSGGEPAE